MCLNPIHITRNPSYLDRLAKRFDVSVNPYDGIVAYDVPCGKCEECKRFRITDYVTRSYYEYIRCDQCAIFSTLTYSDSHIPLVEVCEKEPLIYYNPNIPSESVVLEDGVYNLLSTWYKPHVTKFLKSLNEKLIYYIGSTLLGIKRLVTIDGHRSISNEWSLFLSDCPRPLKYIVTCERGSSNIYVDDHGRTRQGTARPHYHVIFFINHPLLRENLDIVYKYISEIWSYGHTYDIRIQNHEEIRNPVACIEYVCKYIFKDVTDKCFNIPYLDYNEEKDRKPFNLFSQSLGDNILDTISDLELSKFIDKGITIPSSKGFRTVNIPRYILEKRLKYRVRGAVSEPSIKTNIKRCVHYDSGHPSPFFFLWDEDYNSMSFKPTKSFHTKVIKTDLCLDIERLNRIRKAEYFSQLFVQYKTLLPNFKSLWQTFDTPLSSRDYSFDCNLFNDLTSDDIYLFILNDLYIRIDQSLTHPPAYEAYILINCILKTIKTLAFRKRLSDYKLSLTDSITNKPELFSLCHFQY